MKNLKISKFKLFVVIALALLVVGMTLLGIFGFNQTVDYADGYEITVKVESNLGDAESVMKNVSDSYFDEKGIKTVSYAFQELEEGETLIFKLKDGSVFEDTLKLEDIKAELKTKIETAFAEKGGALSGLQVTVDAFTSHNHANENVKGVVIASAIAIVACLIYLFFMEKLSGALTMLITSIGSALLSIAVIALARIPASPFVACTVMLSAILAGILSIGIVNRCRELTKSVVYEKSSYGEIGAVALKESNLRTIFMAISIVCASLLLIILGTGYLKLLGLHILVGGAAALFTAYGFTDVLWAFFKGFDKKKKVIAKQEENN
ncbi:MAG: hypothetical protein IJY57_03800 [Clostridia bacterium]|nr:hypothetical protein [Clostridia bacterium]